MVFAAPAAHAHVIAPERPAPVTNVVAPDALYKPTLHQSVSRAVALTTVTVHRGNTLTGIAQSNCNNAADWSGIASANKSQVKNPDMIYPDEKLILSCTTAHVHTQAPAVAAAVSTGGKVWGKTRGYPNQCGDGDGDGWDVQCSAAPAPQSRRVHAAVNVASGTFHGSGGMQQCIISRESGGDSQVTNASGHYGLYQFSYSTWVGHGGSPSAFGHASVGEQNAVYNSTVAADGYSDWAPYDGC
jgi:hypothetical protein